MIKISSRKTIIIALFILGLISVSIGQKKKINLNALIDETQKQSEASDEMTLIWWIPETFWKVNFEQDGDITPKQAEDFMKTLRPYTVLVVVDGKIGTFGTITYKTETIVRNNIQIIDSQGTAFRPLSDDKVSNEAKTMLSMMKPILVNMLGPLGQNMHFVLFTAKNAKSEDIINVAKEGTFLVRLDNRDFKWRLPLGSLLAQKVCPVDGEMYNGAWKFCPWHGNELKNQ